MKLLSLKLNNFRQFVGENTLDFGGKDNKVTVIYGLNGYGKTGLFRAIIFCLFGKTYLERDNLDLTEQNRGLVLVNHDLIEKANGDYVNASVTLKFEHNQIIYELYRSILCAKHGTEFNQQQGEVKLYLTIDGNTKPPISDHDQIKQILDSIIDLKNKDFFLFDGEQMEELIKQSSKSMENIKRGITELLRLDAIKLVKDELAKAQRDIEKEIKDNSLSVELEQVNIEIDEIQNAIEKAQAQLNAANAELESLDREKSEIDAKIRSSAEGAEKQKRKDEYLEELNSFDDELTEQRRNFREDLKTIAAYLGEPVVTDAYNDLKQKADRGELPANIKDDFIKELISTGVCICGNNLNEHPEAVEKLKEYLNKNIGQYAEAGFKVFQMTKDLSQKISLSINKDVEDHTLTYNRVKEDKEILNKKIQGIDEELKGFVNLIDYTRRAEEIANDIKRNITQKGASDSELMRLSSKRDELYGKRAKYTEQNKILSDLQKRFDLVRESSKELDKVYKAYSDELRKQLSACATEIMKKIADRETLQAISKIEISDKFVLDVLSPSHLNILSQISSGQRQVVSIAYICSLMQVAVGLKMPLLMDTPFGRLSGAPRDACLQKLPDLLTQWILLTTDTEFTEAEAKALRQSNAWHKVYEIESSEGVSRLVEKDISFWKPIRSSSSIQ